MQKMVRKATEWCLLELHLDNDRWCLAHIHVQRSYQYQELEGRQSRQRSQLRSIYHLDDYLRCENHYRPHRHHLLP